jgi:hypothetical protein
MRNIFENTFSVFSGFASSSLNSVVPLASVVETVDYAYVEFTKIHSFTS